MKKHSFPDDDNDDFDRSSPLLKTQRFPQSTMTGTKASYATQSKPKSSEVPSLKINLGHINDDNDDDSIDSDDDTQTKTGRSSSSVTTSQLTPKPKDRSFLKKEIGRPVVKPRQKGINDDDEDDERNVFGKTRTEPSPRHQILTRREEEERDQSFMKTFTHDKKRQSPTDFLSSDHKFDSRKSQHKDLHGHHVKRQTDSDDESLSNKQSKHNDYSKSRQSPRDFDTAKFRKHSSKSRDSTDESDDDDDLTSKKSSGRLAYKKEKQSSHDSGQDADPNAIHHQPSSSRPTSASKKETESSARRSSFCEEQDSAIPSTTAQKSQSRPTSAKSQTIRQQTQSVIDNVASANNPSATDPLTSNNEALAAAIQAPPPPPRSSAQLPPRPKPSSNLTTRGGINKKQKFKVPSRYQEVTARIDNGRNPAAVMDLKQSFERAFQKELHSKTLPRPQSARSRTHSASSNNSGSRRRRSSSAYEHVQPRVNTNRSINFDELDTSRLRNDSSQSIKDAVYLEWLKNKEEKRKEEKEQLKRWEEEKNKLIDKNRVERQVQQNMQNLDRWRQEKEKEIIKKKLEEQKLKREQEEAKKREEADKRNNAKTGFDLWKTKKDEKILEKKEEDLDKKTEIELQQEEKRKKDFEAAKAYEDWMKKKGEQIKKSIKVKKQTREDELKKIREKEETKFVGAQEAYEKWLENKEKYEIEEKLNSQRRNSVSNKLQQVPFLPGGSQKNTGKVRHAVW